MSGLDWPAMMRAGLLVLRLTPSDFWRLTPAELGLTLGQGGADAPMARGGLEALMAAYPDRDKAQLTGERDG